MRGGVALVLLLGACAAGPGPAPFPPTPGAPFTPPPGRTPPPGGPVGLDRLPASAPAVLAEVAGEGITKETLADYLCTAEPMLARQMLDELVKLVLLRREIRRLGVVVPERLVEIRLGDALARVTAAAKAAGLERDEYVARRFGVTWAGFLARERVLVRTTLYRERVIRFSQLMEDRVAGRILVVRERSRAEELLRRLRAGGDFAALARLHSRHPSAGEGGRLPPIGRWGVEPALEDLLFRLPEGAVGGPVAVGEGEERGYALVQCVRRLPARRLRYAEARQEVERSLQEHPVSPLEYNGWVAGLERRYRVRLHWGRVRPGAVWPGEEPAKP